jgi:hypothetical protein
MIWMGGQNQIYVLFNDKKQPGWVVYTDEFKDGMPDRDGSLQPPPNLNQPVRGFGLVWRSKNNVRERLGWAVNNEQGFESSYQRETSSVQTLFVRGQDGTIYGLSADGTWKPFTGQPAPTRTPPRKTNVPTPKP